MDSEKPQVCNHIIGCARTVQTAVLVVEYLRLRWPSINGRLEYQFKDPTSTNGYWSADIVVVNHSIKLEHDSELVRECRAFVAGRGEVWA